MAAMGIRYQVLSPMPELLSYWFDPKDTVVLARYVNSYIGEMVARQPQRFLGFGMVPLQDPELAGRELERLRSCGLHGVEIGTNVNGRSIGDRMFDSFFAAAQALQMPVFVHPIRPAGVDRLVGPPSLAQSVGFPVESALTIATLITGGTLERHPRLQLAFSHGGGAFALVLPRLTHMWKTIPSLKESMPQSPVELARTLFYDTLVYDQCTLRYLVELLGTTQLMLGTDYPFAIHEREPIHRVEQLGLPEDCAAGLIYRNAARFLGLQELS
jgi:aminocarboxymuconate-semialdehyde decarboxylase